jgi:hypothetical protein
MKQDLAIRVITAERLRNAGGRHFPRSLPLGALLFFGSCAQAAAYTDPGAGALLWQLLVAGFFGSLFYLRKLTAWFKAGARKKSR